MTDSSYLSTATLEALKLRSAKLRDLREYFYRNGFDEVQTPILSQDTVIDRHLNPLEVEVRDFPARHPGSYSWYLQTSPEQNMKRLLSSGMKSIFQIGPVFRAAEFGTTHNPEFTMAEWYRVGDDLESGIQLLEAIVVELLKTATPIRSTFAIEFALWTGLDPLGSPIEALQDHAMARRFVADRSWSADRDDWIDLIFSHDVQPNLGTETPLVVTHFPATQAALAKISEGDRRTAERFEIFYRGVELANGYHELLDAQVLRKRNVEANRHRLLDGKKALPEESRLLDAMDAGLPSCCGCAMGFDRIVMLAGGYNRLEQVLCFPWDRA